jgi:tripartite-type tricarboxylate transporter receptor subunit TctC
MNKPAFLIAVLLLICSPSNSIAEETSTWSPSQPVRIVVPFQAGGPIDTIARTIAQQLNEKWGQTFIVENRTGAGGNIGMELVAKAPADGLVTCDPCSVRIRALPAGAVRQPAFWALDGFLLGSEWECV